MSTNKVLHISTECYPVAKAGGMADVVGALPKYQETSKWAASVIIPKYDLPFFNKSRPKSIFSASLSDGGTPYSFKVLKYSNKTLDFVLYAIELPELFYRDSIYLNEHGHGFHDEAQRNMAFQRCVLSWLVSTPIMFQVLHCHDHQTGFIPFLIKYASSYKSLSGLSTVYSVHNGAYNSRYSWDWSDLFPSFPIEDAALVDWDGAADSVCAAMRFSDHVNTVSPNYLIELKEDLEVLKQEYNISPHRFSGILNGIDTEVWDPKNDGLLPSHLVKSVDKFKKENKADLLKELYHINGIPLFSFIGRFAYQKGTDLLVPAIERILNRFGFANFFILGSGDKHTEQIVQELQQKYPERVGCYIGYNESLAHTIYAASDFILMPSRFEPCGLNQLFAMRYGALPIARETGGLKDTVVDFESGGLGISYRFSSVDDLLLALTRGMYLYRDKKRYRSLRIKAMKEDNSWSKAAGEYIQLYNQLLTNS